MAVTKDEVKKLRIFLTFSIYFSEGSTHRDTLLERERNVVTQAVVNIWEGAGRGRGGCDSGPGKTMHTRGRVLPKPPAVLL